MKLSGAGSSGCGARHTLCAEPAGRKTGHSGRILDRAANSVVFFKQSPKLRHSHSGDPESKQDEDVILAAEEELAYQNVRTVVLNEVALKHPVVFDVFNLCDMHGSGKLRQLSVAMLSSICEHFDIDVENIKGRRDAPYLSLLREFLESCDCHHSARL